MLIKKAAMARAKALPMDLLLEALDRRDIPYQTTATRVQLETKLADELVRTHMRVLTAKAAYEEHKQRTGTLPPNTQFFDHSTTIDVQTVGSSLQPVESTSQSDEARSSTS